MKLTEESIRKKAEHNDGILINLEEISLHQLEIERIEVIQQVCPKLKILYLQNNIIPKIENLHRLKYLQYLNLALNNIIQIENLEGCEDLHKLDLTLNFIDIENLEKSIHNLKANAELKDLYLTGNPCMDWEGARPYIISHLPHLEKLDGNEILPKDRINSNRLQSLLSEQLSLLSEESLKKKKDLEAETPSEGAYTRENRAEMYREIAREKEEKERQQNPPKEAREVPSVYTQEGVIRQCNQGKYSFTFDEESKPGYVVYDVAVPRYLDTSLIDVDVHPTYFRVVIKGKLLQLRLLGEVVPEESYVRRSKTTGGLELSLRLVEKRVVGGRGVVEVGKGKGKAVEGGEGRRGVKSEEVRELLKGKGEKKGSGEMEVVRTVRYGGEEEDDMPPLERMF